MSKQRSLNYIDNKLLESELHKFSESYKKDVKKIMDEQKINKKLAEKKAKGNISDELGIMFLRIAYNLSNKHNFNNYTYKDEMIGLGIEYMCRFAKKFDITKNNCNGFSYCTQICNNGFIQAIQKEQNISKKKDEIIKENMLISELDKWATEKGKKI